MSMNINIRGVRKCIVKKSKKEFDDMIYFEWILQTPTDASKKIMSSPDPLQAYKDWVKETWDEDEVIPVFSKEDCFGDEPSETETYNAYKEHMERLNHFIKQCEYEGYEFEIFMA